MNILVYFSTPLFSTLSSIPIDSKSVCLTPKSLNTLGHEPGLSLSSRTGGAITKFLPSYAGFLIEEETTNLQKAIEAPIGGKIIVMGGAKTETKVPVIKNFIDKDVSNELELNDDEISWLNNF